MPMTFSTIYKPGIYKITNILNNKFYIGSAVSCGRRWNIHKCHLLKNKHHSKYLQNTFNKYGLNNFTFEIIELVEDFANDKAILKECLLRREQYYIDSLKPEYNIAPTAGSNLGYKFSEESRNKISSIVKG